MKKVISIAMALLLLLQQAALASVIIPQNGAETSFDFTQYDFSDPSLRIENFPTDEEFFGVWNEEKNDWDTLPKLNYAYVSKYGYSLEEAETFAKQGNYEKAEEAVLEYYRAVNKRRGMDTLEPSTRDLRQANLLLYNMHDLVSTAYIPSEFFSVSKNWETVSVSLINSVQYVISLNTGMQLPVGLYALTKDDYEAVFYSKDSEYEPYLELVVNGMTERLKPTKDAYVAAGEFSDENYGYDEFLRCRESGVGEEEPVNSETRRSFLVFDLSAYDAGDTISSAVLYLKGRWEDKSENIRNDDSYEKKLVAISDMKDNWAEDTFTFKTNSTVIFSYEGEFGTKWLQPNVPSNPDEVFESNLNRFSWMKTLTSVYKDTGDETYALAMFMYLHHFIETTYNKLRGQEGHENSKPTWPEGQDPYNTNEDLLHGGYSNSLDLSVRSYNIALNLIYYYDSENMTPELFSVFLKYMWSMGNVLSRFFGRSERAGNWGDYSNRGFYALMSYYPEFAATDEWMEIFLNRIDIKAKGLTLPDGSSEEGSISYTTTGFNYPFSNVTLAKKLGEQLIYSEKTMSKLTDLVKYCTNMILPWGGDPGFGDGNSHKGDYYSSLLNLVEWLGDPELLYVYTGGKKGTEPTWKSSYYDFRKMLTMRSGWNDDALYLYTTSSGSPYSHNHWDSLEIILAAYGEYLLIDPGYYSLAKDDLIHRWLQSSRAHNTIEINDTRQKKVIAPTAVNGADNALPRGGSKGDIIDVEFNDAYSFARVITENCKDLTYGCDPTLLSGGIAPPTEPGMDCHRDILFVNSKFYIVSDYMDPVVNTKENKYTQIWHTLPGKGLTIDGQYVLGAGESIGDLYSGDVDSQIENTHFVRGTGNGMLKTTDESGTNILIIPADIDNVEPKLLRGLYSHTKNAVIRTEYGVFDKYATGTTGIDTILFPVAKGDEFEIKTSPITLSLPQGAGSSFSASIKDVSGKTNDDYKFTYYILHESDKKAEVRFGNYETDAMLAYYEEENLSQIPRRAILKKGSHISDSTNDYDLLYSKSMVDDLSVEWSNNELKLASSRDVKLEDLTIYSAKQPKAVYLNGKIVSAKYGSNYVYFSENPILNGDNIVLPQLPEINNNQNNKVDNSISHGSNSGGGGSATTDKKDPDITEKENEKADEQENDFPIKNSYKQELEDHWGKKEITSLIEQGIVQGDGNSLNLKSGVTRAEFTALVMRALGIEGTEYNNAFDDVKKQDWYAPIMQRAFERGIIEGYKGLANPAMPLTREQAVKIMISALDEEETEINGETSFEDNDKISSWAKYYVNRAVALGLIKGLGENEFSPYSQTTREQAMVMVYRILNMEER